MGWPTPKSRDEGLFRPPRRALRALGWGARLLALAGLYFGAALSAVLLVGASVVLPGALMFELMRHTSLGSGPSVLLVLPSFLGLFVAMSGLLKTVDRAESALLSSQILEAHHFERTEGQLSVSRPTAEHRGRLSLTPARPEAAAPTADRDRKRVLR